MFKTSLSLLLLSEYNRTGTAGLMNLTAYKWSVHTYIWRRHLLKREFQENKYTEMDYLDLKQKKSNANDEVFDIMPINNCE